MYCYFQFHSVFFTLHFFWTFLLDIEQEKTHQNIFQGVATFDKSTMRQTSTTERVSLPTPEGDDVAFIIWFGEWVWCS